MFGVFWGIFMILILSGAGNGLQYGVMDGFKGWATNAGFIWTQSTTKPYMGFKARRRFRFQLDDIAIVKSQVKNVGILVGRHESWGVGGENSIVRKNRTAALKVYGDFPDYIYVESVNLFNGRYLNDLDIEKKRKVAVLGKEAVSRLFEKDENPIGQLIQVQGVSFKVVGVFESLREDENAKRQEENIHIPFTTFQTVYNRGNTIGWMSFIAKRGVPADEVEVQIKQVLKKIHKIHPEDDEAIGAWNFEKEVGKIDVIFTGVSILTWFVGIGTLLAGIIGISNIMLIIVKERTSEIGVRKSMGATPGSIISLIMQESVVITLVAGYIGLFIGLALVEAINYVMSEDESSGGMFKNPHIDPNFAVTCLGLIIISGCLAGIIPAMRATRISPIEALRAE